jgi:hypothetical protein
MITLNFIKLGFSVSIDPKKGCSASTTGLR